MSDVKTSDPRTNLTIKPTHFPKVVIACAAACWGLAVVGAIAETLLR